MFTYEEAEAERELIKGKILNQIWLIPIYAFSYAVTEAALSFFYGSYP